MLAVVFGEASRSGLRFSSPSPLPGGILFAVQPLACSHAHALSAHCHGRPSLSITVTGLKSTKNEPAAQHTPQSKPMWLDCLTVRCVRSEDQPRTRHPRLTSLHRRSLHPLLRSEQLPAGVGGTVRGVEARARLRAPSGALALRLAAGRPRWWIGFALNRPTFPSLQRWGHHVWPGLVPILCASSCLSTKACTQGC